MLALLLFCAPTATLDRGDIVVSGSDAKTLAVYVQPAEPGQPAVLGSVRADGPKLRFTPRFALTAGLSYVVVVGDVRLSVSVPKPVKAATTTVRVFPTGDVLPENTLKFYLHFSTPMAQGDVYRHIKLLDDKGKAVFDPFLELDQELWDASGTRFTLFFDPGRIKRGLSPREEFGPPMVEGRMYTLVIDRAWKDEDGLPMKETFKKTFKASAPDEAQPDVKAWKVTAPAGGARGPVRVALGESLDNALLERMVWVEDATGRRVAGAVAVGPRETEWTFTPNAPWPAGAYRVVADTRLEDLAGNSVGRPFEVDILRPVEKAVMARTASVPFRVRAP